MPLLQASISLQDALATVPAGAWAVAVSGGADSVALLELLLAHRKDLSLHVVHLDHETRGGESALDAVFVQQLAVSRGLPWTIARRSEIEQHLPSLPRNRSARFRACRIELFRQVVAAHALRGVMLAHHADDQAETIVQRLLRGSGPPGLRGMSPLSTVAGVSMLRPLLGERRAALRQWLVDQRIGWREDASNLSPAQQRNRVRATLEGREAIVAAALRLGEACSALAAWLAEQGGAACEVIEVAHVRRLAPPVARDLARRWLMRRAGSVEIPAAAVERLYLMAIDAASPARQHFPGGLLVRRRGGRLVIDDLRGSSQDQW